MNAILQCLLNIDPFRYDLMVTNAELITSSLLPEDSIYLYVNESVIYQIECISPLLGVFYKFLLCYKIDNLHNHKVLPPHS